MMIDKETPLFDVLNHYIEEDFSRFHMPGHKGALFNSEFLNKIALYDVTEIEQTDSLYDANGVLLRLEQNIAKLYGAKASFLSASGSTLCIMAMLALCVCNSSEKTKKIIMGRNIHKAAINAAALIGFEPLFVDPKLDETGLMARYEPNNVEVLLKEHRDCCGVYITTPDYYGVLSDIAGMKQVCLKYNVPLLVDNAHGAALRFYKEDRHPITLGADMCCDSFHKTLPVFTGGAVLHIANEQYTQDAKSKLALFGTTSPSYLIMSSIDLCVPYLKHHAKEDFERLEQMVIELEKRANEKNIKTLLGVRDFTKLTFYTKSAGFTGYAFDDYLKKFKIQTEYADEDSVVLMPSPFNSKKDFDRLSTAIEHFQPTSPLVVKKKEFPNVQRVMSVKDAVFSQSETIEVANSEGRVAAETKALCPPGVPMVIAGELITDKIKKILLDYGVFYVKVVK